MSRALAIVSSLLVCSACLPSRIRAEDWPQWRGPDRTGHVTPGARIPLALPDPPKVVWQIEIGEGLASPVVAANKVFYFDNQNAKETLHVIKAGDAQELWRASVDDTFTDEQGPSGPRCTPVVEEDRVYAQSGLGELQCLSVIDGHRLWRVNFRRDFGAPFLGEDSPVPGAAEHGYTAAPVLVDNRLIACAGGTNGSSIVCFEKNTGQLLWKSQDDRAAYAAPVIATLAGVKQVVCFTVEGLLALDLDKGSVLWRIPLKTPYGRNCITPVVSGDLLVAGSYRAGLMGIKVSVEGQGIRAERVWSNKNLPMNFSSPVCVGRHLYGLGPSRQLVCAAMESGQIAWSKQGYFETPAELAHAAFLVMGENILVLTDDGQLGLFAADPAGFRELGRQPVCGRNWCNPAYAGGCLYVRDSLKSHGNLYCLQLVPSTR
jgi:outer membrane protein assembly factor BamB